MTFVRSSHDGTLIDLKIVPSARQDRIIGPLGDRLKIRVSAPPEGGKANKAACQLLAKALGIKGQAVRIVAGATHPQKTALVRAMSADEVRKRLSS